MRRSVSDGAEGRQRWLPRGAGRQHPPTGRRGRCRGAAQQDRPPGLDVPGHTFRASAGRRSSVRAAQRGATALLERRPQRVRAHARLHPEPAGPVQREPRPSAIRDGHRRTAEDLRGLPLLERLPTGR